MTNNFSHLYYKNHEKSILLLAHLTSFSSLFVGVLVEAMREGHWIILDELNLAPTEVMEALNRVGF